MFVNFTKEKVNNQDKANQSFPKQLGHNNLAQLACSAYNLYFNWNLEYFSVILFHSCFSASLFLVLSTRATTTVSRHVLKKPRFNTRTIGLKMRVERRHYSTGLQSVICVVLSCNAAKTKPFKLFQNMYLRSSVFNKHNTYYFRIKVTG